LLGFASLHILANNFQPLKWALCLQGVSVQKSTLYKIASYSGILIILYSIFQFDGVKVTLGIVDKGSHQAQQFFGPVLGILGGLALLGWSWFGGAMEDHDRERSSNPEENEDLISFLYDDKKEEK